MASRPRVRAMPFAQATSSVAPRPATATQQSAATAPRPSAPQMRAHPQAPSAVRRQEIAIVSKVVTVYPRPARSMRCRAPERSVGPPRLPAMCKRSAPGRRVHVPSMPSCLLATLAPGDSATASACVSIRARLVQPAARATPARLGGRTARRWFRAACQWAPATRAPRVAQPPVPAMSPMSAAAPARRAPTFAHL